MSFAHHLPALAVAVPLFGAFGALLASWGGKVARNSWFIFFSTLSFLVSVLLWHHVSATGTAIYVMGGEVWNLSLPSGMVIPVRILLEVDRFSALMSMIGGACALGGALFSLRFMEKFSGLDKYTALFLLLATGLQGMVLTGDLFNLFVFVEISSVASFGLVAFWKDRPQTIEAGFKYMLVSTVGVMFILLAIAFLYGRYNTVNMAGVGAHLQYGLPEKVALIFLVAAFAMKCGSVPMHMWTPDAYAEAPAAVTCLLVAVSQASLYALFRICFSIYGLSLGSSVVGWAIIVLGCLSMFIGVSMAVVQKEIKRLMAFHSVSQVGYILLGLGVGLLALGNPQEMSDFGMTAVRGGVYHLLNYAMYKPLLFLCAGALFYTVKSRNLNDMGGLARQMPITTILFAIAAAAIAGLPPFSGYTSKLLIYESSFAVHPLLPVVAMVTSMLTLASFVKVFQTAFLGPEKAAFSGVQEVPRTMILGMVLLTVFIVGLSLFPSWSFNNLIAPAAEDLVSKVSYVGAALGGGF